MRPPPSLSIIVMCRNHERYVAACIRSIVETVDQPCELVLLDNGSRDRSVAIARELLRQAPSWVATTVLPLDHEQPLCRALNIAHQACSGELVKMISADDRLGPNFFPAFRHLAATSERAIGVWLAGSVMIDADDRIVGQTYGPAQFGSPEDGPPTLLEERHVIGRTFPLYTAISMFHRRHVYDDVGGFDETFRYEDKPFYFNVLKRGWKIAIHPYNNTYYRQHDAGISADPAWMADARLPVLVDFTWRASWRNKPLAAFHLARCVRIVARNRWRRRHSR